MVRRSLFVACAVLLATSAASARGWDPPSWTLTMDAFGTSNAFPGSVGTGPDRGVQSALEASAGLRLSRALKAGFTASAGGLLQREFTRANYGWLSAGSTLRRNKTQLVAELEWTPRRDKFPSDPEEGGTYEGLAFTAGMRWALGARARLRLDATADHATFEPGFGARDSRGRELYAQATLSASPTTDLRADARVSHDETRAARFTKDTRVVGAGAVWKRGAWRADALVRSGLRRYPDANRVDSNFRRRDQWVDARLKLVRALRPRLALSLAGSLANQSSSRLDRGFDVHTLSFGLEWTGGGH